MAAKGGNQKQAMIKWDEELAKQAQISAGMEDSTATGQFFSLKAGVLSWNGAPIPGNQMAVVILDGILENVFYSGKFEESNPTGPMCFAFGRDDKEMAPHQVCQDAGSAQGSDEGKCAGCPMNEWATAETGRGKACRNTRRLAMIPAGSLDAQGKFSLESEPGYFETVGVAYMRLPVTSVKGYAAFVKQVAGGLKRPPHGIVTKVQVVPDQKSQFKVVFTPIMSLPDELMGQVMRRHDEAKLAIAFPYQPYEAPAAPVAAAPKSKPVPKGAPAPKAAPVPSRPVPSRPVPKQSKGRY